MGCWYVETHIQGLKPGAWGPRQEFCSWTDKAGIILDVFRFIPSGDQFSQQETKPVYRQKQMSSFLFHLKPAEFCFSFLNNLVYIKPLFCMDTSFCERWTIWPLAGSDERFSVKLPKPTESAEFIQTNRTGPARTFKWSCLLCCSLVSLLFWKGQRSQT